MNFILCTFLCISYLNGHTTAYLSNKFEKTYAFNNTEDIRLYSAEQLPTVIGETVKNFYLFTRRYREGKEYERLDPHNILSIRNSHFGSGRTYFVVHGFLGDGLESWILELKDKLLARSDCNVVSVEWPSGTEWYLYSYHAAARRVPAVGSDTADLIQILIDRKGLLLSNLHMIGHSLGAHICGFAGKRFLGRIAKISGLDPAGPDFRNLPKKKRLDKSDAVYVDVIHTNACVSWFFTDCYGTIEDLGHTNFWPNGGAHQPYCSLFSKINKLIGGEVGCNHELAYSYYIESLDYSSKGTYFLARQCSSWDEFVGRNCSCGDNAQFMGINSNPDSLGKFFLRTNDERPFAMKDNECIFSGSNWVLIFFFVSVAILAVICVFGLYCSYRQTNNRYAHIYNGRRRNTSSSSERTPLLT